MIGLDSWKKAETIAGGKMEGSLFTGVFADKRCQLVFSKLVSSKSSILHKSIAERASLAGAYRFMNNRKVTYELIRDRLTTSWGVKGKKILCLQDTSEANFAGHSGALKVNDQDLGPVGNIKEAGFFMHPCLCLDMRTRQQSKLFFKMRCLS